MRISDWSSDVCSSDLDLDPGRVTVLLVELGRAHDVGEEDGDRPVGTGQLGDLGAVGQGDAGELLDGAGQESADALLADLGGGVDHGAQRMGGDVTGLRSEEHTSELQSLMRISYAVFCLKKKKTTTKTITAK